MVDKELLKQMEEDVQFLATKYSFLKLKVSTIHFERDYELGENYRFALKKEVAIVRYYGQVRKVTLDEETPTYEDAEKAVIAKMKMYYKKARANRSDAEKRKSALRQRKYRELKKQREQEMLRSDGALERQRRG